MIESNHYKVDVISLSGKVSPYLSKHILSASVALIHICTYHYSCSSSTPLLGPPSSKKYNHTTIPCVFDTDMWGRLLHVRKGEYIY